jgi:uncharacterized protein YecT (DUF1311 family)
VLTAASPLRQRASPSRFPYPPDDCMMRVLRVSLAVAGSAVLLAACEARTRAESGLARVRESALAQDLQLVSDTSTEAQVRTHDTTVAADSLETHDDPSCSSPARDDQQRCLAGYLAESDALLDRYYQALIVRLEREAGASGGAAEPPTVQRLRAAQRAWLVYRDDECRKQTREREGPLWAPVRAQCLGAYSALRTQELQDALAKRPALTKRPAVAAPKPKAKPKRPSARKATRHTRARRH